MLVLCSELCSSLTWLPYLIINKIWKIRIEQMLQVSNITIATFCGLLTADNLLCFKVFCFPEPLFFQVFFCSSALPFLFVPSLMMWRGQARTFLSVMDWIISPHLSRQILLLKSLPTVPQYVTVPEDRAFKEVFKVNWGHMVGPWSNMTDVLLRKGRDTGMYLHKGKTM